MYGAQGRNRTTDTRIFRVMRYGKANVINMLQGYNQSML